MRPILIAILLAVPLLASANCTADGQSVFYINGIQTTSEEAKSSLKDLRTYYVQLTGDRDTRFFNAYNQTHGTVTDVYKTITQMLQWDPTKWNEDTNGDEILNQIHEDLTTQKVLLVGHSQGSFYSNETYKYLTTHGVSTNAVKVFNIATPVSYTAGNGQYITSVNDTVIEQVRKLKTQPGLGNLNEPLPSNVTLQITSADPAGHGFSTTYLAQDAVDIASRVQNYLSSLRPTSSNDLPSCFDAPNDSTLHKAIVSLGNFSATTGTFAYLWGAGALNGSIAAVGSALDAAHQVIVDTGTAIGGINGLAHSATPQYESTNFNVANHIFGSDKQMVDGENVYQMLHEGNPSQGGAVILATVQDTNKPASKPATPSDPTVPAVPVGPAPGFSPGGGGSAPANVGSVENVADATPVVSGSATQTNDASTTDATTTQSTPAPIVAPGVEPIVINEIAWSGSFGAPTEQWVELYNNGGDDVSLDDIVLSTIDGSMYIPLSGTITAHGYYILATTENSIFNLKNSGWNHSVNASLALNSAPVQLMLSRTNGLATTTLDQTPDVSACGGVWCAGVAAATDGYSAAGGNPPMPVTMERIKASVAGSDSTNWGSADGYDRYAYDFNQQWIIGTPYNSNSSHWPMTGFVCAGDTGVLTPGSTYTYRPASNDCHYLSGYVGRDWTAVGVLLKGVVSSSTIVTQINTGAGPYKNLRTDASHYYDFTNANSGDTFTVVFFSYNNNMGGQYNAYYVGDMLHYLETGFQNDGTTASAPYSYQTLSFVIP